jgi:hypothetical protein
MNDKERARIARQAEMINDLLMKDSPMTSREAYLATYREAHGRSGADTAAVVLWVVLAVPLGVGAYLLYGNDHLVWAAVCGVPAAICALLAVTTYNGT